MTRTRERLPPRNTDCTAGGAYVRRGFNRGAQKMGTAFFGVPLTPAVIKKLKSDHAYFLVKFASQVKFALAGK